MPRNKGAKLTHVEYGVAYSDYLRYTSIDQYVPLKNFGLIDINIIPDFTDRDLFIVVRIGGKLFVFDFGAIQYGANNHMIP